MLKVGNKKFEISKTNLENYFSDVYTNSVKLKGLEKIGEGFHNVGFLAILNIRGRPQQVLLRIVRADTGWGHDYLGDRASLLLLQHELLNSAPKNKSPTSIDIACLNEKGKLLSIGDAIEFINLIEVVDDQEYPSYSKDLINIANKKRVSEIDIKRCRIIADYLSELHSFKKKNETLYKRHIRDLIGHGEMLMGVIDTYPNPSELEFVSRDELMQIELKAVEWRNKIKYMSHRLSRIHGDMHPFGNIRFKKDNSILVMDFAREKFGDPADDIAALSINYLFFSIRHYGEYKDPFKILFNEFFSRYLEKSKDNDILKVLQPFYAFRGLVVCHPLYYPDLKKEKRRKIINFIQKVLETEKFEIDNVEKYFQN
jgi:thiamine kinase-like enzyme